MKLITSILFAFSIFAGAAMAEAVNAKCPFTGNAVDAAQTVTIDKAVSFCCGNCLKKFNEDPAAMAAKVAKTESQKVNETCPISGKGIGKTAVVDGQLVGVCCGKCAKKAAAGDVEVKATKPATALCPVSGKAAKVGQTATAKVTVAFCCEKCVAKAKANPGAVLQKL